MREVGLFVLRQIQHTYSLTDEQGPAHKKTFFVKLKLGEEEFSASGQSIKKAQHAAASVALEQTKYKRPPIKNNRHVMPGSELHEFIIQLFQCILLCLLEA